MFIKEGRLSGEHIVLEPLTEQHIEPLQLAVADGEDWRTWYINVPAPDQMPAYVCKAINRAAEGDLAYAVRLKSSGEIVGTTRFYNVDPANRRANLGYTWYAQSVRRTAVNTECKLIMLENLFASQAIAVEFQIHSANQTSRRAVERLGAKLDGILRSHKIMPDGSLRDSAIYSIIASEWPLVRERLLNRLGQG